MKILIFLFSAALLTACGPQNPDDIDPTLETSADTSEKIKEAQNENVELEAIDGELDSIIKKLN